MAKPKKLKCLTLKSEVYRRIYWTIPQVQQVNVPAQPYDVPSQGQAKNLMLFRIYKKWLNSLN